MKTQLLFEKLVSAIKEKSGIESIFEKSDMMLRESGMILNKNVVLSYGFFPFGTGILREDVQREDGNILEGGIMVLGNDFGTLDYLKNKCPDGKENKRTSATIRNLIDEKLNSLKLDTSNTFFTNIYLGLRNGASMTRKMTLENDYKAFCYDFFLEQLNFINPKTIICLGKQVGNALADISDIFESFKNVKICKLLMTDNNGFVIKTNDKKFGKRKFILIPHPSLAHNNWKNGIREKILKAINSN